MSAALPDGWAEASVAEIGLIVTPKIDPQRFKRETFELYSVPSFDTQSPEFILGEKIGSTRQLVKPGDVLLCKINPRINRVWMVGQPQSYRQIASTEWVVIRAPNMDPKFLMYQMRADAFREQLLENTSGIGGSLTRTRPAIIRKLKLVIAPTADQRQTVERIEAVDEQIASTSRELTRVLELLAAYRQRTLSALVEPDDETEWVDEPLGSIGRWGSGGTPPTERPEFYGGDVPWIRSGDLPDGFIRSHNKTLTALGFENSSAKWVPPGAVLIAMYGATIGKLGIATYRCTTNQAVAFCEVDGDRLDPLFLFYSLLHRRKQLIELGQGGAQPNISQTILKRQRIAYPSLEIQRQRVLELQRMLGSADEVKLDATRSLALLQAFKRATLTKGFSGGFVARRTAAASRRGRMRVIPTNVAESSRGSE